MEKLYKKITGATIAILLVSVLATSGQYFAIPAISALDQTKTTQTESNSTSLSIHGNTLQLANNQSIVFLPKHNNTTHVSTAFSTSKLAAKVGRSVANIGATLRNDGYCFPYAFLGESGCGNLQYNNGPVMHNAKILLIFWLGDRYSGDCSTSYYFESPINDPTATSPNDCSYMNLQVQFLKDMCSDPFMKIATQYTDTTGKAGPCTVYANAGNPWIDTNPFPHNPVLDVDLRAEAAKMLARMSLPASLNTQVYIFTPYGIDSCFDTSGGFCFSNTFCAYHFGFGTINYVNMPDVSSFGSGCGNSPSPNNDPVADLEVNPLSHEVMESLTDPSGRGWMFNMMIDHEIGDQCTYDDLITVNSDNSDVHLGINGNPYFIQTEWSNSNGGCTLTDQSLPLPPFDPPTRITAVATSPSSIIISWATSLDATSYHVFRSTSPTGPFSTLVGTSLTTSLTDTGLSPGTQYYYEITASNTGGTSPMSKTPTSVNPSIINVIPISSAFTTFTNPPAAQVAPISSKVMSISSISTTFTNPPAAQVTPISSKVMSISSISTTFTNPPTSQVAPISSKVTPTTSSKVTNVASTTISISSIVSPASNSLIGTVHGYDFTTSIVPSTSRSLTGVVTPAAPAIVSPTSNSLIGTVQEYGSTTSIVPSTSRSLTGVVTVITTGH